MFSSILLVKYCLSVLPFLLFGLLMTGHKQWLYIVFINSVVVLSSSGFTKSILKSPHTIFTFSVYILFNISSIFSLKVVTFVPGVLYTQLSITFLGIFNFIFHCYTFQNIFNNIRCLFLPSYFLVFDLYTGPLLPLFYYSYLLYITHTLQELLLPLYHHPAMSLILRSHYIFSKTSENLLQRCNFYIDFYC